MHEKNLKHKTEKENKTKRGEMKDKSNQNAASHTANLESIDTKCKKFYQEIEIEKKTTKPDSSTKRLGKLELKLELNLLCHIWLQFQRLIPQTSSDARLRWGRGVARGEWRRRGLVSYLAQAWPGCVCFGVRWVPGSRLGNVSPDDL